jgi:hypothetical protein
MTKQNMFQSLTGRLQTQPLQRAGDNTCPPEALPLNSKSPQRPTVKVHIQFARWHLYYTLSMTAKSSPVVDREAI